MKSKDKASKSHLDLFSGIGGFAIAAPAAKSDLHAYLAWNRRQANTELSDSRPKQPTI